MYKFRVIYFAQGSRVLQEWLDAEMAEAEKSGYEYCDLKFAQSSASGTGMSAILVLKDKHEATR